MAKLDKVLDASEERILLSICTGLMLGERKHALRRTVCTYLGK